MTNMATMLSGIPTRIWMTCSGSNPTTGFPSTSTRRSPGWSKPNSEIDTRTHRIHYCTSEPLSHTNTHTHTAAVRKSSTNHPSDKDLACLLVLPYGGPLTNTDTQSVRTNIDIGLHSKVLQWCPDQRLFILCQTNNPHDLLIYRQPVR